MKCPECQTDFHDTYKGYTRCRRCVKTRINRNDKARYLYRKKELIRLHGGCCEICGYKRNISALTFHHIDPSTKSFELYCAGIKGHSWEDVLNESNKCQLLCQNCHHELHNPNGALNE